ncbi:MAG: LD-carboxypeptidase [Kofleriaceae bacterium]|nr:LD-carboxypeptidase [Kofleriaceae bacterium]MBP9166060.1 LD-carboxypeptidase [Kofleriaceae bacterium]MBP9857261.1 LD-carboxypeptidase [Kofleriaceae bacterium]
MASASAVAEAVGSVARTAIVPPAVAPHHRVRVCAPAGPIRQPRFDRGLARLGAHLRLEVAPGADAATGYLAGDDRRRADELTAALRDPDVRAVIMARGGYGLTRILADVDPAWLLADPKPLVGFSDGTALLAWAARAGVRAIHGPVITQLAELPASDLAALVHLLTDPRPLGVVAELTAGIGAAALEAPILPGNLTLLAHLVGTPWQLDVADAVVLLEEVGEAPYRLDRELTQLALAGVLRGARGAIVGDLTRCTEPPHRAGEPDDPGPARAAVAERLARFGLPTWWDAPVGHGARNLALPFGGRVAIDDRGRLAILDGAVA